MRVEKFGPLYESPLTNTVQATSFPSAETRVRLGVPVMATERTGWAVGAPESYTSTCRLVVSTEPASFRHDSVPPALYERWHSGAPSSGDAPEEACLRDLGEAVLIRADLGVDVQHPGCGGGGRQRQGLGGVGAGRGRDGGRRLPAGRVGRRSRPPRRSARRCRPRTPRSARARSDDRPDLWPSSCCRSGSLRIPPGRLEAPRIDQQRCHHQHQDQTAGEEKHDIACREVCPRETEHDR